MNVDLKHATLQITSINILRGQTSVLVPMGVLSDHTVEGITSLLLCSSKSLWKPQQYFSPFIRILRRIT